MVDPKRIRFERVIVTVFRWSNVNTYRFHSCFVWKPSNVKGLCSDLKKKQIEMETKKCERNWADSGVVGLGLNLSGTRAGLSSVNRTLEVSVVLLGTTPNPRTLRTPLHQIFVSYPPIILLALSSYLHVISISTFYKQYEMSC